MKLVSVIVATYKRDSELKAALESLAEQTYPCIEIVLVDDKLEKFERLLSMLDEVDDVQKVYHNVKLPESEEE